MLAHSPEDRARQSAVMKERFANGTSVSPALGLKGKDVPAGYKNAKGPNHYLGKYWAFKSPDGFILEGRNLNELVRTHTELFDSHDLIWRGRSRNICNAVAGLTRLHYVKKGADSPRLKSWKGWILFCGHTNNNT